MFILVPVSNGILFAAEQVPDKVSACDDDITKWSVDAAVKRLETIHTDDEFGLYLFRPFARVVCFKIHKFMIQSARSLPSKPSSRQPSKAHFDNPSFAD